MMSSSSVRFLGARAMHGPYGLGPTGLFSADKVPLVRGVDGSVAGPWSLLRYFPSASKEKIEMQWWSISPENGKTLFSFDEYGVCNVLKYVYDVAYLLTHGIRWDWEMTLDNIVDAARKYGTWNDGRALLKIAATSHISKKANEHTHQVLMAFFTKLAEALPEDVPESPDAHATNAPVSPTIVEDDNDTYDPENGLEPSDDDETAPPDRDPWGFESEDDE